MNRESAESWGCVASCPPSWEVWKIPLLCILESELGTTLERCGEDDPGLPRGEPQSAATPFKHKAWEGAALQIPAQPSPRMTAGIAG